MGEAQSMESLISLFERLEDPRVERTRDYSGVDGSLIMQRTHPV